MQRRELLKLGAAIAGGWATSRVGAALPPAIPIIDTHIHLFDPGRPGGVPWPAKTDTAVYKAALPEQYESIAGPFGVVGQPMLQEKT
jgi:L-fuconolactonase